LFPKLTLNFLHFITILRHILIFTKKRIETGYRKEIYE
jgi:hypothetical protein